jgi:hypothetical protein
LALLNHPSSGFLNIAIIGPLHNNDDDDDDNDDDNNNNNTDGSGAHPASYPMVTRHSFPGGKAAGV